MILPPLMAHQSSINTWAADFGFLPMVLRHPQMLPITQFHLGPAPDITAFSCRRIRVSNGHIVDMAAQGSAATPETSTFAGAAAIIGGTSSKSGITDKILRPLPFCLGLASSPTSFNPPHFPLFIDQSTLWCSLPYFSWDCGERNARSRRLSASSAPTEHYSSFTSRSRSTNTLVSTPTPMPTLKLCFSFRYNYITCLCTRYISAAIQAW
ncbi:hypothetical protein C8R44DRAFT_979365 [Mycena epipterygia]|nr:hypothetical protein C8R44DRAFT_979365 [Mycena epipterygia]